MRWRTRNRHFEVIDRRAAELNRARNGGIDRVGRIRSNAALFVIRHPIVIGIHHVRPTAELLFGQVHNAIAVTILVHIEDAVLVCVPVMRIRIGPEFINVHQPVAIRIAPGPVDAVRRKRVQVVDRFPVVRHAVAVRVVRAAGIHAKDHGVVVRDE